MALLDERLQHQDVQVVLQRTEKGGRFSGIPSLFVVDEEGRIANYIAGYGDGDTRLEKALDALLEESP